MRVHRCVGVGLQSPLLFKPNSNHFSIETIASCNRGQAQTGRCPAGEGRDRSQEETEWEGNKGRETHRQGLGGKGKQTYVSRQMHRYKNTLETLQPCAQMRDTHQRPLFCCRGAWEGGQQSDYSPDL